MATLLKKYDIQQGIEFTLKAITDKELLKWSAAVTFLPSLAFIAPVALGGAAFYLLTMAGQMLPGAILFGVAFIAAVILAIGASLYATPRALVAAMSLCGLKAAATPTPAQWLKFSVRLALINFFVWYDRKFFLCAVAVLLAILMIFTIPLSGFFPGMGPASEFLPIIAMLLLVFGGLPYAFGSTRHSIRTSFASFMFLRGDGPEAQMPKKSYDFVTGMTRSLFVTYAMLGGIAFAASIGVSVAGAIFGAIIPFGSFIFNLICSFIFNCFSFVMLAHIFKHYWENSDNGEKKQPMFDAPAAPSEPAQPPSSAGAYGLDHMYAQRQDASQQSPPNP